ncbi:hypothetical protein FRC02_004045 [Tulasnella sp. 418]|nr:hypothetical protein FRC02_004045 [Tulasnella sp. 418]
MKTELDEGAESVDFEKESLGGLGHRVSSDEVGLLGQPLDLANAKRVSPLTQALLIFRKRLLILKRSWLAPLLALVIACCGACISLTFMERRDERCELNEEQMGTWPASYHRAAGFLASFEPMQETVPVIDPPSLLDLVNASSIPFNSVAPGSSFEQEVEKRYRQLQYGGLSVDLATRESQVAYYAEIGQLMGPVFVNLASNVLLNSIQGKTGIRIIPEIGSFPSSFPVNTEKALKWIGFFVAALALFPAFSILYVTKERASGVKSMHLSNGLTPLGLHLGHLLAELPLILITMTIIIIVFTTVAAPQFAAPGLLWLVLVLYGIAGTLLAFVGALLLSSPLIAFATYGAFSVVISILYISGYILTLTYANPLNSQYTTDVFHYTLSLLGPVPSMARAGLVSVNLFALLCDGLGSFSTASRSSMGQFGAPITYLVLYIVILFAALVWTDSGFPLPKFLRRRIPASPADINPDQRRGTDVAEEATRVATSNSDPLRVLNISKTYPGGLKAVDDVSFGVRGEFFSLLGPNGAGKTTTFNIISGNINPDTGNVFIRGSSIRQVPNEARVHLGLCPQFSAIDSEMTVREHLSVYGRLRGLSGNLLKQNIDTLLEAADLVSYSDRLASKLSGGNQRKLSLAIALMGNPSVLLIDEYSTGIDPSTKRKMWKTLKRVATGKAVVLTTHSMEEASALSQRVAIISGKMLAIGTVDSLVSRYPSYEIHFSCRSPEETARAQAAVSRFEGSRPAEDVATRWEVPLSNRTTLAGIFKELSEINDIPDFTIERLSLESVFLKTIRNSRAVSEEVEPKRKKILGVL